ncbi:MAG: hypothetical protein QNK20_11680 [Aureibaculum sp.]|nr:hypothetical protein [Aureibaculum sp.]
MITLKIKNIEIENQLTEIAKDQKKGIEDVAIKAIKNFLDSVHKQKFIYEKKNVAEHMHVIHKEYDVDDFDDVALQYIHNSAEYIHNQRREIKK